MSISMVRFLLKHKPRCRMAMIDISKAFDSVSHDAIFLACKRKNLNMKSIRLIRNLYNDCHTTVGPNVEISDSITIRSGVKQGDSVAGLIQPRDGHTP